jgi:hypothetical protein
MNIFSSGREALSLDLLDLGEGFFVLWRPEEVKQPVRVS